MLPSLSTLNMKGCLLPPPKLLPLSHVNYSQSLRHIDLSSNDFNTSHVYWLPNITRNAKFLDISHNELWGYIPHFLWAITSLTHLDLSLNRIEGRIPFQIGNLMSLEYLDLSLNRIEGRIPFQIGNLMSLEYLDLSRNNLEGRIPDQLGNITSLQHLDLTQNNLQGVIPQLGMLPNLRVLNLNKNNLTSILPGFLQVSSWLQELRLGINGLDSTSSLMESIGRLSNLRILDISSNNPSNTVMSQAHLTNLSALQQLFLSNSPLNISLDWVPPFQLQELEISSCSLGPHFPQWLQTQNNISVLDLSNNGISAAIPDWFCNVFNPSSFQLLDLSRNDLSGNLSTVSPLIPNSTLVSINLSSNNLSGPIPPYLLNVTYLDLSNNFFLGSISVLCTNLDESVEFLDLSNNSLSGELPDCWSLGTSLEYLNLADNNLSGNIPESMGSLPYLQALHLRNNKLSGELPSSLMNCTYLEVVDVMENNLLGNIPIWIGESLCNLVVLSLRSNMFHGNIPPNICKLQHIHILDLSLNNLSGGIPWCFDNFTSLSSGSYSPLDRPLYADIYIDADAYSSIGSVLIDLKGIERMYTSRFDLMKLIDLSSNKLTGVIPHQVTNLKYLISLNLSRNYLSGVIPGTINNLSLLETLDLSRNQLSGAIPPGLSGLSFLDALNLSYNNLSGRIPLGTQLQSFNYSVYQGNSGLCGAPLAPCDEDRVPDFRPDSHSDDHDTDDDELLSLPFYIGATLGFIVGFWGVFGCLVMKRSWRIAYFQWLSRVKDDVYVQIALGMARVKRRFQ